MMKELKTIRQVVKAFGGGSHLAASLGIRETNVSNWIGQNAIPTGWHYRLHMMALERNYFISPLVFGFEGKAFVGAPPEASVAQSSA
jgi:hypothetical protein